MATNMFTMDVDGSRASVMLERAPESVGKAVAGGMVRVGLGLVKWVKDDLDAKLKTRTGTMKRAVFYRVEIGSDGPSVVVGGDLTKAKYFRAQVQGGQLKPTTSANLAIPIGEALTAKGVGRFTARQFIDGPQRFGYTGSFFRNRVIFGVRDGRAIPLFVLRPSVTLKPTGTLARALVEKGDWARSEIEAAVREGLANAG